jgi:hypothetical protein
MFTFGIIHKKKIKTNTELTVINLNVTISNHYTGNISFNLAYGF